MDQNASDSVLQSHTQTKKFYGFTFFFLQLQKQYYRHTHLLLKKIFFWMDALFSTDWKSLIPSIKPFYG